MTDICGAACSGRTSLLLAALASRTAQGEVCALVDARDSFDPLTADAAGVALGKMLWGRCQNIEQALRATGLLVQAGGVWGGGGGFLGGSGGAGDGEGRGGE